MFDRPSGHLVVEVALVLLSLFACTDLAVVDSSGPVVLTPAPGEPVRPPLLDEFRVDREEVDVLFVITSDPADQPVRDALALGLPSVLAALGDADPHVGVVSADGGDDGLLARFGERPWLDEDDALLEAWSTLAFPSGGQSTVRDAVVAVLANNDNIGFFRPWASLHVVAIYADDDASETTLAEAVDALAGESVDWHCLVPATPSECSELTEIFGGIDGALGDPAAFDALGPVVADIPTLFSLASVPELGTVKVTVTPDGAGALSFTEGVDWDWSVEANAVVLRSYVPPVPSTVEIRYVPR